VPLPALTPAGRPWPRVSIVTPSYNQGAFLEETIRSVLLQGYPNLEYLIIDGGSTDASVEIIRRYEPWLTYWTSAPDGGQSEAINKGFGRTNGEILCWLNSDDVYEPGVFGFIAEYFIMYEDCLLLYGNGSYIDESGSKTGRCEWIHPFNRKELLTSNFILQPSAFWHRCLWESVGALDVSRHWAMDWEWFIRATSRVEPHYISADLARFRITANCKTMYTGKDKQKEIAEICRIYGGLMQPTYLAYRLQRLAELARERPGPRFISVPLSWLIPKLIGLLRRSIWRNRCLL